MPLHPIDAQALDAFGHGYPRPQLCREHWYSLNGKWDFAIDADATHTAPDQVTWSDRIQVPFAPEADASGIGNQGFFKACWYRRIVDLPHQPDGARWMLHFGAVDWCATVWVNGVLLGCHEGGYSCFAFELPPAEDERYDIVLRAEDDPQDLAKPRGKQDWQLEPHSIWYPRTTGIWQTVWIEAVPSTRVGRVAFTPFLSQWAIGVEAWLEGPDRTGCELVVSLTHEGQQLALDRYVITNSEVHRSIALSDPGIDDSRNELLWSPDSPTLIDVALELKSPTGESIERLTSYCAIRSVSTQGDRFLLNGRPYLLRMVLDQGYWRDGGLTAPDDRALRRDVELAKQMGFNGARKHQKVENPRYLYWADRLGLAIWEEMPSAYRFTPTCVERLFKEWTATIKRDFSHPCIVSWVPINESWGVPNLPENPRERHYVHSLYHLTKTLDSTRPVIGNDGWESVATDIIGIHDYDDQTARIRKRYHAEAVLPRLFKRERPGGRVLVLEPHPQQTDLPLMLSEFGGIAFMTRKDGAWGYSVATSVQDLASRYENLLSVVRQLGLICGFCYTQFADTYQEANGLLYADRTPKIPLRQIAAATAGPRASRLDVLPPRLDIDPETPR